MLQKMTRTNEKGFTLIELMIVIAIIGILAAIAIPNFISYRNKSFCATAESDGASVAAAVANYFSVPSHTATPAFADLTGVTLSGAVDKINTATITGANPNTNITITVTDISTRCPTDYTSKATVTTNAKSFWTGSVYTKVIR
ncbi:MAG: prepilin-type N-terminal cleavage/methylation domain-containing protein [Pseudomonadota bacterium]